jgi:polyisoprenoid-binding protein YceI
MMVGPIVAEGPHRPRRAGVRLLPVLLVWMVALAAAGQGRADDGAPVWRVDPEASELRVFYRGSPVSGGGPFRSFDAAVRFDPDRPEATRIRVVVDVGSLRLRDREADAVAREDDWLDPAGFPTAVFEAEGAKRDGAGYLSRGTLTLKGVSRPLDVTFEVAIDGARAVATGSAAIDRHAFGIGLGDREEDDVVADVVGVSFTLTARRDGGDGAGPGHGAATTTEP